MFYRAGHTIEKGKIGPAGLRAQKKQHARESHGRKDEQLRVDPKTRKPQRVAFLAGFCVFGQCPAVAVLAPVA
jgi:hypothetical protein